MKIGVYPGTFDPITNGHLDIIERVSNLFDKVYVCVANNINKKTFFSLEERVHMCKEACKKYKNNYSLNSPNFEMQIVAVLPAVAMF